MHITPAGAELLRERRNIELARYTRPTPKASRATSKRRADNTGETDESILSALKKLRTEVARREGVPPYIVFSDKTLRDMAQLRPRTREEFAAVEGVGERKLARYWKEFTNFFLHH